MCYEDAFLRLIPNFFFDDILFSFYWRTGSGTDDTIAEDKSSIPIYHHRQLACIRGVCFVERISALWVSTSLCPSRLQDSVRPPAGPYHVCLQIASCWLGGETCYY
jgi:hypothetical protein